VKDSSSDEGVSSVDEESSFHQKFNLFKNKLKREIDFKEPNLNGRKKWVSKKF
jgi:hypothetical protein